MQEESTGVTHSRKENADDNGVVRGVYEVLEPNCMIRRIEYQADHAQGFQILNMTRRSCNQEAAAEIVQNTNNYNAVTASATILPPPSPSSPRPQYEQPQHRFKPTVAPNEGHLPPPPIVPIASQGKPQSNRN